MARSKSTEETIEKLMSAVLEEARENKKSPELVAAILAKMREGDPKPADAALATMIDKVAASLPEDKRQKFMEELLALARPN